MNKNSQNYFTTGDFARLVGVSKDTLFHYDRIGIFSPEIKGENDYRYYSIYQAEVFYVIAALKELDMPLKKIKAYLDRRSPKELINLLEREEKELDKKIRRLQRMKNLIGKKAEITRSALDIKSAAIFLEERRRDDYLVITEAVPYTGEKSVAVSVAKHYQVLDEYNIYSPHSVSCMVDVERIISGDTDNYDCFFTRVSRKSGCHNFTRSKGTYLTAYHTSGYSNILDTYNRMLAFARNKGLALQEFFYEDVLLDELSVKGYEKYLIKLSVQVARE